MPAPDLFKSISNSNIAEVRINPFPTGKKLLTRGGILFRHEYELLADKLVPQLSTFKKEDRTFKITDPENVLSNPQPSKEPLPGKVYFLLEEVLRNHPEVRAAYLYGLPVQSGRQRSIVGFEFSRRPRGEEIDALMGAVGRKLKDYPEPDFGLDMCALTGEQLSKVRDL